MKFFEYAPRFRRASGQVLDGDLDFKGAPLENDRKIACCLRDFRDGLVREMSGAVGYAKDLIATEGRADGCQNHRDTDRRIARLDQNYDSVAAAGELLPVAMARPGSFRKCGGVLVQFGREEQPLFGMAGRNRPGIALAPQLAIMPAQLGAVRPDGLAALADFRSRSTNDTE